MPVTLQLTFLLMVTLFILVVPRQLERPRVSGLYLPWAKWR